MVTNTSNSPNKVKYTGGIRDLTKTVVVNGKSINPIKRFDNPVDAYNDIYHDIHLKLNGGSNWVKPETTIEAYIHRFAPKEDKNDPKSYTQQMITRLNDDLKSAGSSTVISNTSTLGNIKSKLLEAGVDPDHAFTKAHLKTEDPTVLRDLNKEPSSTLQSTSTSATTPTQNNIVKPNLEVKPKVETKIEPKVEVKPKTVIKVPNKELTKNLIENNIPKTESSKPLSNNDLVKKTDEALQQAYYEATNPANKGNKKVIEKYSGLLNIRKKLIDNINTDKAKEAGFIDNFLNTNLPENGMFTSTALNKLGVTDEVIKTPYDVPKFESYLERATKNKEKELVTKKYEDLNPSSSTPYLKFRYSASNSEPIKVNTYSTRKNRNDKTQVSGKGTLMHFLDEDPLTGFQHPNTKNFYKRQKPEEYVGVLEERKDGSYLKVIPKKDVPANSKKFLIRQTKFDDIEFNKMTKDRNFEGHTYWTDKKTGKATIPISIAKDPNDYNKTSGQAVIFIFNYKGETRYINFANSPNAIREEGERIKKEYKLKSGDLTIGLSDAGSFSAASRAKNNKITNSELMSNYYNTSGDTGAGMSFE